MERRKATIAEFGITALKVSNRAAEPDLGEILTLQKCMRERLVCD